MCPYTAQRAEASCTALQLLTVGTEGTSEKDCASWLDKSYELVTCEANQVGMMLNLEMSLGFRVHVFLPHPPHSSYVTWFVH
jgi:hypothetical protein